MFSIDGEGEGEGAGEGEGEAEGRDLHRRTCRLGQTPNTSGPHVSVAMRLRAGMPRIVPAGTDSFRCLRP